MKITVNQMTGSDFEDIGYKIIHRSITGIMLAGFVVIGLELMKLRLTISSHVQHRICLTPIIFSLRMGRVTIERVAEDGSQRSQKSTTSS